jgi:hypothetical protein
MWNPSTGTPAILVYTQVHRCGVSHTCGQVTNFTNTTFAFAKLTLAMSTLCKMKSVKTALSNTNFVQITKSNQDQV